MEPAQERFSEEAMITQGGTGTRVTKAGTRH